MVSGNDPNCDVREDLSATQSRRREVAPSSRFIIASIDLSGLRNAGLFRYRYNKWEVRHGSVLVLLHRHHSCREQDGDRGPTRCSRLPQEVSDMVEQKTLDFLIAQERQSRDLARESEDASVRKAHVAMAEDYARRILAANLDIPI